MSDHEDNREPCFSRDSRFESLSHDNPDPTVVRSPVWGQHTEAYDSGEPYGHRNRADDLYRRRRFARKKRVRARFLSACLGSPSSGHTFYQRSLYGRDGCHSDTTSTADDVVPYDTHLTFEDSQSRGIAFPHPYTRRTLRFWRWFRTIPLVMLVLATLVAYGANIAANVLPHTLFYPVHNADAISESSGRHGVDPYLVCAVIKSESGWNENAKSNAGAIGLMQLMPATAEEMTATRRVDSRAYPLSKLAAARVNIEYGCAYLAYLQRCCGSRDEVIAAYNAGIGNVRQWRAKGDNFVSSIAYGETRAYLTRVTEFYARYKEFYPGGIGES